MEKYLHLVHDDMPGFRCLQSVMRTEFFSAENGHFEAEEEEEEEECKTLICYGNFSTEHTVRMAKKINSTDVVVMNPHMIFPRKSSFRRTI